MKIGYILFVVTCLTFIIVHAQKIEEPLIAILITADDLGYGDVDSFGGNIPDLIAQLDKFSNEDT